MDAAPRGLVGLLRSNIAFRRLWFGAMTSQFGDYVDLVAQIVLLMSLTGSAEAVAYRVLAATLPPALIGPWAGVAADWLPRKTIMIAADVLRGFAVLSLLLVTSADLVWIVYAVTALRMTLAAFFDPASKAVTAAIVAREDLVTANTINILTFAVMFAWGAALGGVLTWLLGTSAAFLFDASTFFISAACTASVAVPLIADAEKPQGSPLRGLWEGIRFLAGRAHLTILTLTGACYGAGGGGLLVLLSLYGTDLFPWGTGGSISLGLLYASVGLGSMLGPLAGRRLSRSSPDSMYRLLGPCFFVLAVGFVGLSFAPNLASAALALVLAYAAGTTIWLYVLALLQMEVPDRLRGRVFALSATAQAITTSLSSYFIGAAADTMDMNHSAAARQLSLVMAGLMVPPGVLMTLALRRKREPENEPNEPAAVA